MGNRLDRDGGIAAIGHATPAFDKPLAGRRAAGLLPAGVVALGAGIGSIHPFQERYSCRP